jgi:HSP20 family protein
MEIQKWIPRMMGRRGRRWPELDVANMLEDFFRHAAWPSGLLEQNDLWSPDIDVSEQDGEVVVRADLPGMAPDDLQVEVADRALTLKGKRKAEKRVEEEDYYCAERWSGAFSRTIPLPAPVSSRDVKASFKNGVLEIHLPETGKSGKMRIPIQS